MEVLPNKNEKGLITAYTGPMFSGKSSKLLTDYRRSRYGRQYSLLFKPSIDVRYDAGKVSTHSELAEDCNIVSSAKELDRVYENSLEEMLAAVQRGEIKGGDYGMVYEKNGHYYRVDPKNAKIQNVFIDEAQFFDSELKRAVQRMQNQGTNVYLAFLTQTSGGRAFPFADNRGNVTELLEMADFIQSFTAVCFNCGHVATKTYKLHSTGSAVEVGGPDTYSAACVDCWEPRE